MRQLRDRVAVVTGAASGIGRGIARQLAGEGARLVLADVETQALDATVAELCESGATALGVTADVSDPAALDSLRDQTLREYGAVHVLCNNAGVAGGSPGGIWEAPLDDWSWVMGVNLMGIVHGLRSFVPAMLEQGGPGHIVNTASMAGLIGGLGIYGVSKHAAVALSESLAVDLQSRGAELGVSVLCPGWVHTRILESERNRPEGPRPDPGELAPEAQRMTEMLTGFVEGGMDPDEVGRIVCKAIRENTFYVLTHPWQAMVRQRMETIVEGRQPVGPAATLAASFEA